MTQSVNIEQRQRIRTGKKRRKRKLARERIFFLFVIALLLFLYLDAKAQLREVTAAVSLAEASKEEQNPSAEAETVRDSFAGINGNLEKEKKEKEPVSYADKWGMETVEKPVQRSCREVLDKLEELAPDNNIIKEILKDPSLYPDKLLEALANNPEMADFVRGYPDCTAKASGGLTKVETSQDFPLFLQWDPRWGYVPYGDNSNIAISGCGPVSLSMALYYLTGNESLTPDKLASYSMKNGYYVSGTGTAWALMTDVPPEYGIGVTQPEIQEYTMKQELDDGRVLIASMKPGDFTAAGHFLVIYGYDQDGFLVNDPNCVARSKQSWSFHRIGTQIKNLWSLG